MPYAIAFALSGLEYKIYHPNYKLTPKYLRTREIKKYWKDEKQFQANFIVASALELKEQIVYTILLLANKLCSSKSGNWSIVGPYEGDYFSFACILNNRNEGQALKWAHIEWENDR